MSCPYLHGPRPLKLTSELLTEKFERLKMNTLKFCITEEEREHLLHVLIQYEMEYGVDPLTDNLIDVFEPDEELEEDE